MAAMPPGPAPEAPNVLHHVSALPDAAWTRVNAAEALPGLLTPLGWTFWDERVELALRGAFADMGVLRESEVVVHPSMDQRFTAIFYGRFTGNLDMLRDCADRTPGTSGSALEEQMFGAVRPGVHDRPTRARYPAIAVKMPWAAATIGRRLRTARHETDRWWHDRTTAGAPRTEQAARGQLAEAAERFRAVFRTHLLNTFLSQAVYEQLTAVAAAAGRPGLELRLATGFGGMEESRLVADLWEVSRDRKPLADFVADHGYHGFSEGDISRPSWRENPAALHPVVESYRERADEHAPAVLDARRRADRDRARAELASALGRPRYESARLVMWLTARHIPLREVGKVCFLQAIDVGRAAAKVLGTALAARDAIERPEDVYFLTLAELLAGCPDDARERIGSRRVRHAGYAAIELPQAWVGQPHPVTRPTTEPATESSGERVTLQGLPVFPGVVEGRAVVVEDPGAVDFDEGDVLVCEFTDPSWAMLMCLAGAMVINIGGAMSHGAIVARELGVPTVISTGDGTRRLRTGDRVRVDAAAGTVHLLERAEPRAEPRTERAGRPGAGQETA
jgi:pyruvate,water dikinase